MLAIVILIVSALALKVYWDYGQDQSARSKTYMRELDWRIEKINKGINPTTMLPFEIDRRNGLHNVTCTCELCREVEANNAKIMQKYRLKEAKNG